MSRIPREILTLVREAAPDGWVLEPAAKKIFARAGLSVPRGGLAENFPEALVLAQDIGYPLVAKVVSPEVIHKADVGGVVLGITDEAKLEEVFHRLRQAPGSRGVLVEETVRGLELILGAKMDYHFGPIILLGLGGTGVEVYRDVTIKMAPLDEEAAADMYRRLKGHDFLLGFRGQKPVALKRLTETIMIFSRLVMALAGRFSSIDLNPLICTDRDCFVADARIILP
jgi:succinyl-CoA synthetase beta subunit